MALHDYVCAVCGTWLRDVNVPISIGAQAGAPLHCGTRASWVPQVSFIDAKEPFQEFETRDGRNNLVVVDSLRKMRQLERESEQQYRDGEGQPLVFRRWSQDRSNQDVHAISPERFRGGEQPDPAYKKKFGLQRMGSVEPDVAYGPGISDATPSALDRLNPKD